MSEQDALSEARVLSYLLVASSDKAKDLFATIANEMDIPVSVTRALCAMEGPAPMSELASRLRCDKSYITPLADQLEEMSLVKRVPGPDRRVKMLELTPQGIELRNRLEARIAELSPAMNSLTESERSVLKTLLEKIS
ncbi:MarR family winged helix-turn-helix transcriptional regulator [Aurantimicrobium minutum]|uniref:MarR family winged helix-turn-helix transcriptional regulator n=1 Tax=Aurantimicrobium minutum TaxID=708131 RepID=UPI002476937C|nr:MarR family transcriptional regulator [Aurantimicrobium minutum]MDH6423432.1 DNA-binding MarR family transcriptional regulator [Aurantimicrobium minutum]